MRKTGIVLALLVAAQGAWAQSRSALMSEIRQHMTIPCFVQVVRARTEWKNADRNHPAIKAMIERGNESIIEMERDLYQLMQVVDYSNRRDRMELYESYTLLCVGAMLQN